MPRKPKRPCSFPGCPNLTEGRFCEEHEKQENRRYEKYDRDPAVRRRYGRVWKRIRDRYVSQHPFCEMCYKQGVLKPVEEVHHKLPLLRFVHFLLWERAYFNCRITSRTASDLPESWGRH